MEAKLKALKVAELKELLQKANVAVPAKANKADLIAKVLESPAAVDQFSATNKPDNAASDDTTTAAHVTTSQDEDLLAPPEEFDWDTAASGTLAAPVNQPPAPSTMPISSKKPTSSARSPAPDSALSATQKSSVAAQPTQDTQIVDVESDKRKQRAERFGIPLVEQPVKTSGAAGITTQTTQGKIPTGERQEKLKNRSERFPTGSDGTTGTNKIASNKRPAAAVVEPVDAEEAEKRRKRTERFKTG